MIATSALLAWAAAVFAQEPGALRNVVELSASGVVKVPRDWLTLTLSTTREGRDAATVQAQLQTVLDAALAEARQAAAGQEGMAVRTGRFSLSPRYGSEGRIDGWRGSAALVLEGSDIPRVAAAAGRVPGLVVESASVGLSRAQRTHAEAQAQALAIKDFQARADEIAHAFGFTGYVLREVRVQREVSEADGDSMLLARARRAEDAAAPPLPVAPGSGSVTVSVSGTVQMTAAPAAAVGR